MIYIFILSHPATICKILPFTLYPKIKQLGFGKSSKDYKNSVITSWKITEKRLNNYLRNKEIIYKKA